MPTPRRPETRVEGPPLSERTRPFKGLYNRLMPELILISGGFGRQACVLKDGTFTVGRSGTNQLVIQDSSVSAQHCELLVYGSEVIVRERGSRNGTFVDGVRVTGQSGVRHGQHVRFGTVETRLDIEAADEGSATGISAIEDYRKIMRSHAHEPKPPSTFPVVWAPVGPEAAASPTRLEPTPPTPEAPPPAPLQAVLATGTAQWRRYWPLAALIALLGLVLWLLTG